ELRFILSILLDNIGFTKENKKMSKLKMGSTDDVSDQDREPFVETGPSGRFGRYPELLGSGAMKNVYRGFDMEEGRDVAWNQIKMKM
nr:probable serine/threonine-protein kinase WNK11 [Tanacetum cinerariifolium]